MSTGTTFKLREAFRIFEEENAKFDKGNKSAGTRARKALQEIKGLAQSRRKEISSGNVSGENENNADLEDDDKDPSEAA